jgi:hypothetical protein
MTDFGVLIIYADPDPAGRKRAQPRGNNKAGKPQTSSNTMDKKQQRIIESID